MSYDCIDSKRAEKIDPFTLMSYLNTKGWVRRKTTPSYYVYRKKLPDNWDEVTVPTNSGFSDYTQHIISILDTLSRIESRSAVSILSDIVSGNASDGIQYRLMGGDVSGTAPLDWVLQTLQTGKRISAAAYMDLSEPKNYHKSLNIGFNATRNAKMGQTAYGSYIIRIIYPFDGQIDYAANRKGDELIKQLASKIVESMNTLIMTAVDDDTLNKDCGISYNFVDSIMSLKTEADNSIEVSKIEFNDNSDSKFWIPPVVLSDKIISRMEHVADDLKPPSVDSPKTFSGRIHAVQEVDYDVDVSKFKVDYFDEAGGFTRASVELDGEARRIAIESIPDHSLVSFEGRLEGYGRSRTIREVSNFHIVR